MRIAVATCLAGALLIACTVEAPPPRENDSEGKPGAAPPNVEARAVDSSDSGAEPSSDADVGADADASADADAGTWTGVKDVACAKNEDCPPSGMYPDLCVGGYCGNFCGLRPGDCIGGQCRPEKVSGTSVKVCEKLR